MILRRSESAYHHNKAYVQFPLFSSLLLLSLVGLGTIRAVTGGTPTMPSKAAPQLARFSDQVAIQAKGRGNPYINLSDGRDIITAYGGPEDLIHTLESNQAQPLSLASADFDEDGVPDLISGYAGPNGGIITLHRGNVDSIYPNAPKAKQRKAEGTFTDSPFLSPALVLSVPVAADFIGAGDFDGDSHWDVVAGAKASNRLHLLSGDGKGNISLTRQIELPGSVTAMVVGEINRRDGLDDIIVGVVSKYGSKALIFEGPEGALRARPEIFDLPDEATSLALGQLDASYEMDLAVAAGRELVIVQGRDRKLSFDEIRRAEVPEARITSHIFPSAIRSIAVGDFSSSEATDIAVLTEDGVVQLMRGPEAGIKLRGGNRGLDQWRSEILTHGSWGEASLLVRVRVSSMLVDNLVVIDSNGSRLDILTGETEERRQMAEETNSGLSAVLDVEGEPVAVLPMRLNSDALSDLVILQSNRSGPIVAMTQPQATFVVTNTNDSGPGSLRQAILDANNNPGLDTIRFSIGSGPQTIALTSSNPIPATLFITSPVVIDGTTQPGFAGTPIIELDGSSAGPPENPIARISAGNSTVRGLVINRFPSSGIWLASGGNVIEGNFIGTDITGTIKVGSSSTGIVIESANNIIGGTTGAARNIISSMSTGIHIVNRTNQVQGNYIGTDVTGTIDLGNRESIRLLTFAEGNIFADSNIIGGTTAEAGNVIVSSQSAEPNVFYSAIVLLAGGNLVQGNYIGTNKTGTASLGNSTGIGLHSSNFGPAANNTIGGTTDAARNIISATNGFQIGISSQATTGNLVQGNFIGTDVTGTAKLGSTGDGIEITQAPDNLIGGITTGARNVISGNGGNGVAIGIRTEGGLVGGTGVTVQGNYIGVDTTGIRSLGNGGNGIFVNVESFEHTIKDNLIAANGRNGIHIPNFTSDSGRPGIRISILSNRIHSNSDLPIELGNDGATPNDPLDTDTGANELQNTPQLTSVPSFLDGSSITGTVTPAESMTINVTFNSTPNSTFTIQLFLYSDCPSGQPQSLTFLPILLGDRTISTDENGNAAFSFTFDFPNGVSGGWVNTTATRSDGNTSEFSRCLMVGSLVPVPTITNASKSTINKKQLIVTGGNFDSRAKLLINGQQQKTIVESSSRLIGKKAGKKVKAEDKLQVRNSDGTLSPEFIYRP